VTVCTLSCSASAAPTSGSAPLVVTFTGSASITGGCTPTLTYDWNFGDGSAHATTAGATHTYAAGGPYTWTFTASAGGLTCTKTGTVTAVNPPVITLLKKVAPPFKIVATGSNLQNGIKVYINDTEWTSVVWKNVGKIQITGGASLKSAVPKGVPKTFRFVNPDGGETSMTWSW
jgi:PKD repeat protein